MHIYFAKLYWVNTTFFNIRVTVTNMAIRNSPNHIYILHKYWSAIAPLFVPLGPSLLIVVDKYNSLYFGSIVDSHIMAFSQRRWEFDRLIFLESTDRKDVVGEKSRKYRLIKKNSPLSLRLRMYTLCMCPTLYF